MTKKISYTGGRDDLIFNIMTFNEMMENRTLYTQGARTPKTRQANALYCRLRRKGWINRIRTRIEGKNHEND